MRSTFGVACGLGVVCTVMIAGQRGGGDAVFDVTSVRPNTRGELAIRIDTAGERFVATNVPVRSLIRIAYDLQDFQISGGPSWMNDDRFDVLANAGRELPAMGGPFTAAPELRAMVRSLLADRFQLVAHVETRELPMFAMSLARDDGTFGPRLRQSNIDCAALHATRAPDDDPPRCGLRISPGTLVLEGVPISQLASALQAFLGRSVVDNTGLTGAYDLQLSWEGPPPQAADGGQGPSLLTALREQAGLRLENTRGPLLVLVIDSIAAPHPN